MGMHNGNGNGWGGGNGNGGGHGGGNGWYHLGQDDPFVGGVFSRYFNEGSYLQNKVDALNAQSTDGKVWTAEEVRAICAQAGMTPQQHFYSFGAFERNAEGTWGINPSADFDLNAYYDAKAEALIGAGHNPEHVAWVVEQFKTNGVDPLSHFGLFGRHENINPTSHTHGCLNPGGCWMLQQNAQARESGDTVELAGVQPDAGAAPAA